MCNHENNASMKLLNEGRKGMKKQLLIIGIVAILVTVGLSGCNEISNPLSNDKTLPDGTKVTGDIGLIEIVNFTFNKYKNINWTSSQTDGTFLRTIHTNVLDSLNFDDINTNLTTRKYFFLNWANPVDDLFLSIGITWDNDYWGWTTNDPYFPVKYHITNISVGNRIVKCVLRGTAKNIGDSYLYYPAIKVNFYNALGAWLAYNVDSEDNIPSGYTWDFNVKYDGQFVNDVNYISYEVKANLQG